MDDYSTSRARRQRAVADGTADHAVDRRAPRRDPGSRAGDTTSRGRQQQARRDVADEIGIDGDGVGTVDRLEGGLDVFLRSGGEEEFGRSVRGDFAEQADFVDRRDVNPGIDPQNISAAPQVARDRRDTVAQRARRETAADVEFIQPADLDAEVSALGVESLGVRDSRRDTVADRTARGLASDDPFAEPGDFEVDVGSQGVMEAAFSDTGARRRAGRQFESETALSSVDPFEDVADTDDGFGLTSSAQQRSAARQFESEIDLFGSGDLDPQSDIRTTGDGFGLAEDPARELAAAELDEQVSGIDVTASDIELDPADDGGFEAIFRGGR